MLKLKNVDDQIELELSIIGYDPPQSATTNWINLRIVVKQGDDTFDREFPALETTDFVQLLDWFQQLANRQLPRYARLSFTEPGIEFEFLACKEPTVRIAIILEHELAPRFRIKQFNLPFESPEWGIVFELGDNDFCAIIDNLEQIEADYPVRPRK